MKTFSKSFNEKTNPYSSNDKVKYDIYEIVEQTFEESEEKIKGKKDLVNSLNVLIKREEIKNKISTLESIKNDPTLLKEKIVKEKEIFDTKVNKDGELIVECKKIKK